MQSRIHVSAAEMGDHSTALELIERIPLYHFATWPEMLVRLPPPQWKPAFKILHPGEVWYDEPWMHRDEPGSKMTFRISRPDDCYRARNDLLYTDPAWWVESYDYASDEGPIMQAVDDEYYDVRMVKRLHSASDVVAFIEDCLRDLAASGEYARVFIADGAPATKLFLSEAGLP